MKPLMYGYMRVSEEIEDGVIQRLETALKDFADAIGYCFGAVSHEYNSGSREAFNELVAELQRAEAHHVVVPSLNHVASHPLIRSTCSRTWSTKRRLKYSSWMSLSDGRSRRSDPPTAQAIGSDVGEFVAGILSDDLSRDDQILFALRLVRLAEQIKKRAEKTSGMVIEGSVIDGGSRFALPAGTDVEPDYPGPADLDSSRQPRAISDLTLAATHTAASCAILFLDHTLLEWGHTELADVGESVMSELVWDAVRSTGVPEPNPRWTELTNLALLRIRLVLLDEGIVIEVADRHNQSPKPSEQLRTTCKRWSSYPGPRQDRRS